MVEKSLDYPFLLFVFLCALLNPHLYLNLRRNTQISSQESLFRDVIDTLQVKSSRYDLKVPIERWHNILLLFLMMLWRQYNLWEGAITYLWKLLLHNNYLLMLLIYLLLFLISLLLYL